MGSGTHSCRYLLQSNQYCNLFGLAKWISVNLNQTKCNATWYRRKRITGQNTPTKQNLSVEDPVLES
jgi:hypothetical protein